MSKRKLTRCHDCEKTFKKPHHMAQHWNAVHAPHSPEDQAAIDASWERGEAEDMEPDWEGECEVCGASPVVPLTGLCGPCSFGEADAVGGNW